MFPAVLNRAVYNLAGALFRRRRNARFRDLLQQLPNRPRILDVGGRRSYWEGMGWFADQEHDLQIVNVSAAEGPAGELQCVADARRLPYRREAFDVVFSNSVIEHLGDRAGQAEMAAEVRRVGKRYFIQTPNRNFPIEPHFLIPLFNFLPRRWQIGLLYRLRVEYFGKRILTRRQAERVLNELKMVTKKELAGIFPEAALIEEKFLGLTKSFMVYAGWETPWEQVSTT